MRNTLLAIALSAAGFAALPAAHAADNHSGFFINGSIGRSSLDQGLYDDNDTGYLGNVGYRWAVSPNVLLGVEGGYAHLGDFSPGNAPAGVGDASVKGWNLGVNGHFNVTDNWYVSGRGGYFRAKARASYLGPVITDPSGGTVVSVNRLDDTSNKWYAGAGFGYDFNPNFSVGLNYDYYRAETAGQKFDPDLVSVSGEYRF
jgi:OOP family OmpA-OmpF porin/outer membrane immunogenic protein